jgi:hypothetical protein
MTVHFAEVFPERIEAVATPISQLSRHGQV